MILHNGLFGFDRVSETLNYSGGDNHEDFVRHLKTQPKDWIYRDIDVTYTYNKNGHRCKDIEDVDLDNYLLFTGCSHTEGVGLKLEDTFAYKVAQELNCDYYNLGMAGTGIDILEYNLIAWLSKIKKKPKYLIVQWPDHSRFASLHPGYTNLIQNGTWTDSDPALKFIATAEESGFFQARKMISHNLVTNIAGCPLLEVQFASLESWSNECVWLKKVDLARDLCHAGIKSNLDITEKIVKHISIR